MQQLYGRQKWSKMPRDERNRLDKGQGHNKKPRLTGVPVQPKITCEKKSTMRSRKGCEETVSESHIIAHKHLARVMATFNRRLSLRKPTFLAALLRTNVSTTASFSRPCT